MDRTLEFYCYSLGGQMTNFTQTQFIVENLEENTFLGISMHGQFLHLPRSKRKNSESCFFLRLLKIKFDLSLQRS
jgi:hypothetical protein